jgi:hypothetical protein
MYVYIYMYIYIYIYGTGEGVRGATYPGFSQTSSLAKPLQATWSLLHRSLTSGPDVGVMWLDMVLSYGLNNG